MIEENFNQVVELTLKILNHAGFDAKVEVKENNDQIFLDIEAEPAALLIGKQGQNLVALERILQVIFYPKLGGKVISCDVAGFRKKRMEDLAEITKTTIEQVLTTKIPRTLQGLTASERRIIHLEVAKIPELVSESQGEGADRVLVVKPR